MSATDSPLEPNPARSAGDGDHRVEVGRYPTRRAGHDHSLVVLATGHPCWLVPTDDGYQLLVEPTAFAAVREQIDRFDRESVGWPPPPLSPARSHDHRRGVFPPLLWALALVAVFRGQQAWPEWTMFGALDATRLWVHGEIWRPFTALFLHAGIGHLVSNAVGGYFAIRAWFADSGTARGWLVLLGASVLANTVVAAAHYPRDYRSLGASTTVFAALGLLTGRALRDRGQPGRWRPLAVPLASGLTMLALFGSGGDQTDVLAHVAGFATGVILGAVTSVN